MKIINLTQTQFENYSRIHSNKNFGQTIEYTKLENNIQKEKLYLGLVNENNTLYAACLIIINNITPLVKEAIAPDGFLIDYSDFKLLETFIKELKKYLQKYKITYLITDPVFKYKVYDKNNSLIENNENILNNLIALGFKNKGYIDDFEKYDVVIENTNSINEIYKNFNRNTKRNIKDSINMGITLHKGKITDIDDFYKIIKKKTKNSLNYYLNINNAFNTTDNKMDIFFTKLNTNIFLTNTKKLYEKEKKRNEQINTNMQRNIGKVTEKLLNKKMNSDNLLEKYHQMLNEATKLVQNNETEIILGTCAIVKNNKEIYFLIDGYTEKYRKIYSSHLLKWAIIKKYYKNGYTRFNLGEIHKNYIEKNNKYHGQYRYKIGFGGNVFEYPPNLLLIINKPIYQTHKKLNNFKIKNFLSKR